MLLFCFAAFCFYFVFNKIPAKQYKIFCPQKNVLASRRSIYKALGHVHKDNEIGYSNHFSKYNVFFQAGCKVEWTID